MSESKAKRLAEITDADELERFLLAEFGMDGPRSNEHGALIDLLDGKVHNDKGEEAAQINNDGIPAQIEYLAGDNPDSTRSLAEWLAECLYSQES